MFVEVYERLNRADHIDDSITLDHGLREKGRFKALSANGIEVRVFLERGKTLAIGEYLKTECGKIIEVIGATEEVLKAQTNDWVLFSKACYHLGNRHVKMHVGERWLYIKPDYVLEEMLQQLGLETATEHSVFVPESGAYSRGHHHH